MARWPLRTVAAVVDGVELGEVLPDGAELDALAGAGGGEGVEVAERRDVRGFVEHEQQRRVERLPGAGVAILRGANDRLHQGLEQRP